MRELIKNAWLGWQNYTDNGKLAALLLIALLLFWFEKKEHRDRHFALILYTTVMTICCICPLTAAVLMKYQTRFYDYQWVWNLVPMTTVIALAGTLLWTELMEKYGQKKGSSRKKAGITALLIFIVFLCGAMGKDFWGADEEAEKREKTEKVLEMITENGQNTDIILWAPQEIMEYARALDGTIRLPYGRNMWDPALNAYSYETYGETENMLYAWMTNACETGEGVADVEMESDAATETVQVQSVTATESLDLASTLGVNCILLPENLQPEILAEVEEYLGIQAEQVEGYYLFRVTLN